jgi:beta-aspartyl-peptidase (threonine type)
VLTTAGTVEMDASIMEGDGLRNGAVAAVSAVRHPISLARRILDSGQHSLFVGAGAVDRARALGVELCDPAEFVTERRRKQLDALSRGTVGAVALDRSGTIAAATSTGGTAGKLPGRVGDSALIGCGTYAESALGGVSCTGDGEAIIRVALARRTLEILKAVGTPDHACEVALATLLEEGRGDGGLIVVDWKGRMAWAHSTPFMPVALRSPACNEVLPRRPSPSRSG